MGYIILIIILLWILWNFCKYIVVKVRDKIEDRVIIKLGLKEDIQGMAESVNNTIEQELNQIRNSVSSFQNITFQCLPGLEDRIERDRRKQNYIHNVLPINKKKRGYKRRKR